MPRRDPQTAPTVVLLACGARARLGSGADTLAIRRQPGVLPRPSRHREKHRSPAARFASAAWSRRAACSDREHGRRAISPRSASRDGRGTVTVAYVGILPDLFREGQGVVALGSLAPDGTFRASGGAGQARRELHAERSRRGAEEIRPLESRAGAAAPAAALDAVKATRIVTEPSVPELGHFALASGRRVRVCAGGACRSGVRMRRDARLIAAAPAHCRRPVVGVGGLAPMPGSCGRHRRFLGQKHRREQPHAEAADVQDHRRLGRPRGLDPAVVPDPRLLRRRRRGVRDKPAVGAAGAGAGCAGLVLRRASSCSRCWKATRSPGCGRRRSTGGT